MAKAEDVYKQVTEQIVRAMESGVGEWQKPWRDRGGLPINATTRKAYSGGNVLALWCIADVRGYGSPEWATYKQWEGIGAQVRKGERSTSLVRWNPVACKEHKSLGMQSRCARCRMVPFGFGVFNAEQVDGYTPPPSPVEGLSDAERVAHAEQWFAAIGADVRHGGDRAYYARVQDYIGMPTFGQFSSAEDYYSTLAHEHTHWTGHESRLAREFGKHFGSDKYAAEELVAELGAAFVCAELGLTVQPREDHASYLAHWVKMLRADSRAIFEAAGKASKAVEYLTERAAVTLAA